MEDVSTTPGELYVETVFFIGPKKHQTESNLVGRLHKGVQNQHSGVVPAW